MHLALGVNKMDSRGLDEWQITILLSDIVGREEPRQQHCQVQGTKCNQQQRAFCRGSSQPLRANARIRKKQQNIRNQHATNEKHCGEHNRSDDDIDIVCEDRLRRNGPRPGRIHDALRTIATNSNAPTDNPNKETRERPRVGKAHA